MTYPSKFKGKLQVKNNKDVFWLGNKIGTIESFYEAGAKSAKGMLTNCYWIATESGTGAQFKRENKIDAIERLILLVEPLSSLA